MQQQGHQPLALATARSTRSYIIWGIVLLLISLFCVALFSPLTDGSLDIAVLQPLSALLVLVLYPILLLWGLYMLLRGLCRVFGTLFVGLALQVCTLLLCYLFLLVTHNQTSPLQQVAYSFTLFIALLLVGLISFFMICAGLLELRKQRYTP